MKQNVIDFKTAMLAAQAKHINLKQVANMSSLNKEYDSAKTSQAKYDMINSTYNMHLMNLAYYIVKHNITSPKEYLDNIHYKNACNDFRLIQEYISKYEKTICISK